MAYDDTRWKKAWERWQAYVDSGEREPRPPEVLEGIGFRMCPGCGIEFILRSSYRRIHFESLDPHALCDGCWRERDRLYPGPTRLSSHEKSCERGFLLDKRGVLKALRWLARKGRASGLRTLFDASAWRACMADGHYSALARYDSARHEAAIRRWLKLHPQTGQNATKAVYTIRDILAVQEIADFDFPERLELRRCYGCGREHLLRKEHLLLYPHPCDPRPLCPDCEPCYERVRARASVYTSEAPFRQQLSNASDAWRVPWQPEISGGKGTPEQAVN